jgi:hypothetical protein
MSRLEPEKGDDGFTYRGWSCDEEGCQAILNPRGRFTNDDWNASGWYKVVYGSFVHRCPEHAPPWREFDRLVNERAKRYDDAWAEANYKFEQEFEQRMDSELPYPPFPSKLYGNTKPL